MQSDASGFRHCFIVAPPVVRDPVAGYHRSGAILPQLAVHEHRLRAIEELHRLGDVGVSRRHNAVHRDVDILHSGGLHGLGFRGHRMVAVLVFTPQVDHYLHAQFGQVLPPLIVGLCPAVNMVVDLMEVRDAGSRNLGFRREPSQRHQNQGKKQTIFEICHDFGVLTL